MLTVNKKALLTALVQVKRFTFKGKTSYGELAQCQLSVASGMLNLLAHDLETQAEILIPASGELDKCLVDPKRLQEVVKMIPGDTLAIKLEDDKQHLTINDAIHIKLGNVDQYPVLETSSAISAGFEMPAVQFKQLFSQTAYAMANKDVRYYLNGMLLETLNSKATLVATDGHRLAITEFDISAIEATKSIIQRDTITRLLPSIKKNDKRTVKIRIFSTTHISIELDGVRVLAKLIDGRYPDYTAALPATSSSDTVVYLHKANLVEALGQQMVVSENKFKSVRLQVSSDEVSLKEADLLASDDNRTLVKRGRFKTPLKFQGIGTIHKFVEVGFNMDYLTAALKQIDAEIIEMRGSGTTSSWVISAKDHAAKHIIMPVRL